MRLSWAIVLPMDFIFWPMESRGTKETKFSSSPATFHLTYFRGCGSKNMAFVSAFFTRNARFQTQMIYVECCPLARGSFAPLGFTLFPALPLIWMDLDLFAVSVM